MKLKLEFSIAELSQKIKIEDKFIFIGSCFADSIGTRMESLGLNSISNPLGISYNPQSINQHLRFDLEYDDDLVVKNASEIYLHLDYHSSINGNSAADLKTLIKEKQNFYQKKLKSANWIFITLGTSIVFEYRDRKKTINNCHKIDAQKFKRKTLNYESCLQSLKDIIHQIKSTNDSIQIVLTLSPVRHIRFGIQENSISKAVLLSAISQVNNHSVGVYYFPAFEILMDELRDYRFYNNDLVHPSELAQEYIFMKFIKWCFSERAQTYVKDMLKIQKFAAHKPNNYNKLEITNHFIKLKSMLKSLKSKYPESNF